MKKHTFIVSIDDGDSKYSYPITIAEGSMTSIRSIYEYLCIMYDVEPQDGIYEPSEARKIKKKFNSNKR